MKLGRLPRRPRRVRDLGRRSWRFGDAFLMRNSDVTYESLMRRPARGKLRAVPLRALPRWEPEGSINARPVYA